MKTTLLLIGIVLMGCAGMKEKTAEEILNDPKMESEIYSAIVNNTTHFTKFMDKMAADEKSKAMLTGNNSLMKMMCMSERMDTLIKSDQQLMDIMTGRIINKMEADSIVCDHTCSRLMKSEQLKRYFMERAAKHVNEKGK